MSLVLFEDCLEHLTRVHRTLRMHRGHVLLVGVGGCGKKCVTRLSAFAAGWYYKSHKHTQTLSLRRRLSSVDIFIDGL